MKPLSKRWALWGAGMSLAASVSGAALYFNPPHDAAASERSKPAATAVPVTYETVHTRNVVTWQQFSGRLEAIERVDVRARVAGAVQSIHFREGALVRQGDILVTIDPAPYEAVVAQAEAQVIGAEARLDITRIELERGRRLLTSKAISQSDLDQRAAAASEAQANLRSVQALLRTAQLNLDFTNVRAPVSGRVGKIDVTPGNLVDAGSASASLTRLVSVDPIYATFNVGEQVIAEALAKLGGNGDIGRIPVEIGTLSDDGTPVRGRLQLVGNEVDSASGTIVVRAVFDNPEGRLMPGQFVRVRIGQPEADSHMLISERAIGTDQDKKFVFAIGADNTIAYRTVQLGETADGMRIIQSGLQDGDRIVVSGLQRVKPGALVDPRPTDLSAAAQ